MNDAERVWRALVALARHGPSEAEYEGGLSVCAADGELVVRSGPRPDSVLQLTRDGRVALTIGTPVASEAHGLVDRYGPLCRPTHAIGAGSRCAPDLRGSFVVAHLGQSLDGRIGPPNGNPEAITSAEDMAHNHRMRALFDAVLVGGGTVVHDDPELTVRHVRGAHPTRVVVDPDRRLPASHRLFSDAAAPTLLLCRRGLEADGASHGRAEVVPVDSNCSPPAVVAALRARGLRRVFVEGGGVTVSRFLEASCLHRLQLAMSPLIMGRGRPGLDLAETLRLRPRVRRYSLADDLLFECVFEDD